MTTIGDADRPGTSGPGHVAVIPDGSRRWAHQRGLSIEDGYRAGVHKGLEVIAWCRAAGVRHLTAFGSSRENVEHRAPEELVIIHREIRALCAAASDMPGISVHVFGAPETLPDYVPDRERLRELARTEPAAAPLILHVGVAYSAQHDLAGVATAVASAGTERVLREPHRYLRTRAIPSIDLVLRTGARARLSGFLPFQAANAELFFLPSLWPALRQVEFAGALEWFAARDRRPGE